MNGYCNYFKCDVDNYEQMEKRQKEMGEVCYCDCQDCECYEELR